MSVPESIVQNHVAPSAPRLHSVKDDEEQQPSGIERLDLIEMAETTVSLAEDSTGRLWLLIRNEDNEIGVLNLAEIAGQWTKSLFMEFARRRLEQDGREVKLHARSIRACPDYI